MLGVYPGRHSRRGVYHLGTTLGMVGGYIPPWYHPGYTPLMTVRVYTSHDRQGIPQGGPKLGIPQGGPKPVYLRV